MSKSARHFAAFFFALSIASSIAAAPLGSAPMNVDGMTLELTAVERKGNVLTVKWGVRNEGKKQGHVAFRLIGDPATTYAVDEENGTKYYVLTDKEKHGLATEHDYVGANGYGIGEYIEEGQTKRFWMKFPAPPPAVKTINIHFTDTEPFEGIAITDK